MVPQEPIGDSSPPPVDLDPHPHQVSVIKNGLVGFVEVVGLKELELQGNAKVVFRVSWPESDEDLAAFNESS